MNLKNDSTKSKELTYSRNKPKIIFRLSNSLSETKKGVKFTTKKDLLYGELGLSFRYLQKVGDDNSKFYKINVREGPKDKYSIVEKKGEKQTESEIDKKALIKMVKVNKA